MKGQDYATIAGGHTVVLDLDGTLITSAWPEMGTWQPGAIAACQTLHAEGLKLLVFTARLNPYDPFTFQRRDPGFMQAEYLRVRALLDDAGLTFVDVWRKDGKPGGFVYVDDRAERYHGRPGSWRAMTEKILARAGIEEAPFPHFDQEAAT